MAEITEAPTDLPKADRPLIGGAGIEVDGYVFTEAKIKIVGGMSEYAIPDPPKRGQCRTYVVKAESKRYLIDTKGEEPRLIIEVEHYVVYDKDHGPLNDRQRVDTPEELDELDRKAKGVADDDDDQEDDPRGGLFDIEGEVTGDLDNEPESLGSAMSGLAAVPELAGDGDQPNGEERKAALFSDGGDKA